MNYEDELERYEDEAEDRYDDYDEDYEDEFYDDQEDDFDSGFEGYEDEDGFYDDEDDFYDEEEEIEYLPAIEDEDDYDEYDDAYDSYKSTSIGKIDPNDRTLTVVVRNTSGADAQAILFGGNESAAQPAGVSVIVEESSHKEVREESKANPFKIAGMKMSVSDPLQFDNVLKVTRRTATGSNTVRVYQPRNATSPQNFTQQLIDDAAFEMDVTGQDSLRLLIKDKAVVVFTFTIKARANMGNLLKGNNVAELSKAPRTTGLPQLDLIQRKKRRKSVKPRRTVRKIVRRARPRKMVRSRVRPRRRFTMRRKGRGRGRRR
ncbi:hypothetical protein QQ008_07645 [Fulvivirgaceae bacterium BMA10]|uniref:Uncharacterized protein n=1 Tax=Splendidivirga corallicola TaxID=3051826 RepID=A0ABT8KKI5_9BACT|nr:hypothetical protein [Fulvivirgaceae bacterium BMA10]